MSVALGNWIKTTTKEFKRIAMQWSVPKEVPSLEFFLFELDWKTRGLYLGLQILHHV